MTTITENILINAKREGPYINHINLPSFSPIDSEDYKKIFEYILSLEAVEALSIEVSEMDEDAIEMLLQLIEKANISFLKMNSREEVIWFYFIILFFLPKEYLLGTVLAGIAKLGEMQKDCARTARIREIFCIFCLHRPKLCRITRILPNSCQKCEFIVFYCKYKHSNHISIGCICFKCSELQEAERRPLDIFSRRL